MVCPPASGPGTQWPPGWGTQHLPGVWDGHFPLASVPNINRNQVLDISKAFDSMNHYLLLNKLVQLNTDSTWFESYLNERTHSVKIDKIMSKSKSNLYRDYPRDLYSVQSSWTFLSMTLGKMNSSPRITTSTTIYADDVKSLFSATPNNLS